MKNQEGVVLINDITIAKSHFSRMKGLMFADKMPGCLGFLIDPCNSIHTFFMKFNLDVAFISKKNEIVHVERDMKPWRATKIYFKAKKVLEMKSGTMPSQIQKGLKVEIECIN